MANILIRADNANLADDVRTSLAALWPEALFGLNAAQAYDLVLQIGGENSVSDTPMLWLHDVAMDDSETGTMVIRITAPVALRALLQRVKELAARPRVYIWPGYRLDTAQRQWQAETQPPVMLTEKEVALLVYLAGQGKCAATRDDLLRAVWNYAADADTHTLETHLYRLRQKIEADPDRPVLIVNNGEGYLLTLASAV